MIDASQISPEFAAEIDQLRDWLKAVFSKNGYRHASYEACKQHADSLAVHADGVLPVALISGNRPAEPDFIQKYREAIYQPITKTSWRKAINVVYRIFQPGIYSIKYKETPAPIPAEYSLETFTREDFGPYYSLMNFVKDVAIPTTFADPNAVMAYFPEPAEPDEMTEYIPQVFRSEKVLHRDKSLLILLTDEKSIVSIGNMKRPDGNIGYIMTPSMTMKFVQVGKRDDLEFEFEIIDQHDLGKIPARIMGGTVISQNGVTYYESMFAGVVPHWNKAVVLQSDMDGFINRHLVPHFVRAQTPCPSCKGVGSILLGNEKSSCNSCNGSGYVGINTKKTGSPYQDTTFDIRELKELGVSISDLVTYVAPPTTNFREFKDMISEHIMAGFSALNMDVLNVGSNQSGIAKAIDRQDLNSFLSECADHFFDQIEWLYGMLIELMYRPLLADKADEIYPEVSRPRKFDYVTIDGIMQELRSAKDANVHPAIMRELNQQVATTVLGDASDRAKLLSAQIALDPYEGMSEDVILALNAVGSLSKTDLYIHANIQKIVEAVYADNPDFLKMSRPEQANAIRMKAESMMGEMPANKAPDAAMIQNLIQLQSRVSNGILTPEAALNLLTDAGIPAVDAKKIIDGFTIA